MHRNAMSFIFWKPVYSVAYLPAISPLSTLFSLFWILEGKQGGVREAADSEMLVMVDPLLQGRWRRWRPWHLLEAVHLFAVHLGSGHQKRLLSAPFKILGCSFSSTSEIGWEKLIWLYFQTSKHIFEETFLIGILKGFHKN